MDVFDLFAKLSLDSSEFDSGLSSAVSAAESLGGVLTGGLVTAATTGVAAVTAVGTAVVGTGAALVSATGDVAAYGDTIDKMSQKIGISAEAYQEWDAVLQHSGASISSLQPVMKTLATQAEKNDEVFQQLGISEQEVATLSQEDLFSRVIEGLQNMEEGTERTYIATQLLGRGATEFGALLNTSAEETQAMKDRVHELNGVMSDEAVKAAAAYQDQLQDMTTAFEGLKRSIMSDFMPSLTTVMAGLTEIFAGNYDEGLDQIAEGIDETVTNITDKLPDVLEIATGIFGALASAIGDNASTIIGTLADVVIDIVEQIAGGAPDIVNIALDVVNTLIDSISSALPTLIPALTDGLLKAIEALTNANTLTQLGKSAAKLMKGLFDGIVKAIPMVIKAVPKIIGGIVSGLLSGVSEIIKIIPQMWDTILAAMTDDSNTQEIIDSITGMIEQMGDSIIDFADVLLGFISDMFDYLTTSDEAREGVLNMITTIMDSVIEFIETYLPQFEEKLIPIAEQFWPKIIELVGKIFEKWSEIVSMIAPYIPKVVDGFVGVLLDSGTLEIMIKGWIDVFTAIVKALPDIIKPFLIAVPSITVDLVYAFIECIPDLIRCGVEITEAIVEALPEIISALIDAVPDIINSIIEAFKENRIIEEFVSMFTDVWNSVKEAFEGFVGDAVFWGADLVDNFISGIDSKIDDLKESVGENGVTGTVRKFMHFSEPDEGPLSDFSTYAPDMMKTFAQGIKNNTSVVTDAVSSAFDFGGMIAGGMPTGGAQMPGLITPTASQPVQVTLVLDKQQLGKVVFDLNNQERQRVGVMLGKEAFA